MPFSYFCIHRPPVGMYHVDKLELPFFHHEQRPENLNFTSNWKMTRKHTWLSDDTDDFYAPTWLKLQYAWEYSKWDMTNRQIDQPVPKTWKINISILQKHPGFILKPLQNKKGQKIWGTRKAVFFLRNGLLYCRVTQIFLALRILKRL